MFLVSLVYKFVKETIMHEHKAIQLKPEHIKNLPEGFYAEQKIWNSHILEFRLLGVWEIHLKKYNFHKKTLTILKRHLWFPYCLNQLGVIKVEDLEKMYNEKIQYPDYSLIQV